MVIKEENILIFGTYIYIYIAEISNQILFQMRAVEGLDDQKESSLEL